MESHIFHIKYKAHVNEMLRMSCLLKMFNDDDDYCYFSLALLFSECKLNFKKKTCSHVLSILKCFQCREQEQFIFPFF